MKKLSKDLDNLRELNDYRARAKELRSQGLKPLQAIVDISRDSKLIRSGGRKTNANSGNKGDVAFNFDNWVSSGNDVEIALLAKIQNHRDVCESDDENNTAHASVFLKNRLTRIKLKQDLMPPETNARNNVDDEKSVTVVSAARAMQVLTSRSETTFSRSSMICYYRIMRELYGAAPPDWTVGAARAGLGGTTSAFVTGECIRALFSLRDTLRRTATFFRETRKLLNKYEVLDRMLRSLGSNSSPDHPIRLWADKTMEAMWLDWFLSTNQRRGQIALFYNEEVRKAGQNSGVNTDNVSNNEPNQLFQFTARGRGRKKKIDVEAVGEYFDSFFENLKKSLLEAELQILNAKKEIKVYRDYEESLYYNAVVNERTKDVIKIRKERLQRTESAHLFANQGVEDALDQAQEAIEMVKSAAKEHAKQKHGVKNPENRRNLEIQFLKQILSRMAVLCEDNGLHVNRIAAPTQQYIKGVLRRELSNSNSASQFDAGELVFAATAFGAMTDWKQHELLRRACDLLVKSLPENGRLLTRRPLHTSTRGYRLLPIGCEMTRSLAQLFEEMNYEFAPKLVGRVLSIFEEKLIPLNESDEKNVYVGWNFESSPKPDCPCVWVSAISVLALDRVVRMLNARINRDVLKHFEVIIPEKPHIELPINDLIYADYGFFEYYFKQKTRVYSDLRPIPIQLELMGRTSCEPACQDIIQSMLTEEFIPRYFTVRRELGRRRLRKSSLSIVKNHLSNCHQAT
ncbi:MAG: hypothetical protein WBD27_04460 [Pyrinomonadaceae bacterium]